MSSGHGPGGAASGAPELEGAGADATGGAADPAFASISDGADRFPHATATIPKVSAHARIPPDARTRVVPRARYAPHPRMTSGPPPAALWVLFRKKPAFDPASVAASLGQGALVEGGEGTLSVRLRGQALRVVSVGVPLPVELLDQCLPVAHLRPDQKEQLESHAAHALVVHEGGEVGVEGLVALYQTAWALRDDAMLGVINPVTWMCLTTEMLAETLKPEFVAAVRASPAESLALWLGFVKLFKPDGGTWLVTRGGWLVGLPDLAWLARDLDETDAVFSMFAGILDYAFTSEARLAPKHTIELGDRALRLRTPYEYVDTIGEDTLVIEPA